MSTTFDRAPSQAYAWLGTVSYPAKAVVGRRSPPCRTLAFPSNPRGHEPFSECMDMTDDELAPDDDLLPEEPAQMLLSAGGAGSPSD
jgi:hypothetical protein